MKILPLKPSLIKIPGKQNWNPILISTLLHGNETTGWGAIQKLFEKWGDREWPRPAWIFLGNPEAATQGKRQLAHQPDFNRIWGTSFPVSEEFLPQFLKENFAFTIDIHNTTGKNPHYSALSSMDSRTLGLAALFSQIAVHFSTPPGTLTGSLAKYFPSITIECGQAGNEQTEAEVADFLSACLHSEQAPEFHPAKDRLQLYESFAQIRIPAGASFSFQGKSDEVDFSFAPDFDEKNFTPLSPGELFGWRRPSAPPLSIRTPSGQEWSERYLDQSTSELRVREAFVPSLLSKHPEVVRSDCLGYVMSAVPAP